MEKNFYLLENTVQEYAWGSPSLISALLGEKNPDGTPKAELWMGVHPKSPSRVITPEDTRPLSELISENPDIVLGSAAAKAHNGRLPFLFKVLAAEQALSIQSHPNLEQARKGFELENKKGIPVDRPSRNYRDDNHKPEIICAVTPFWAMCGFRNIQLIIDDFSSAGSGSLETLVHELRGQPNREGLKAFFSGVMSLNDRQKGRVAEAVCAFAAGKGEDRFDWVVNLNEQFPGDIGVICPLLLNIYQLQPGQAIYLGAGELHAYLKGMGIELMANSDNVLRGGLTPKHIDVDELLRTLTFNSGPVPILEGQPGVSGEMVFPTPAKEFELARISITDQAPFRSLSTRGFEIFLVIEGECVAKCVAGNEDAVYKKGDSFVVPASSCQFEIAGTAVLFRAGIP
ncbi:MAG: mannose-6-phosphate isomerase, class I [Spirochaetales bacterium]|nr:mannose-6-phosphate isomerase, class I [Spirochaetales bacterium]